MARSEAVRAYFGAYESENRDAAEQLLATDFTFCGEQIASVDVYFGAAYQDGVIV